MSRLVCRAKTGTLSRASALSGYCRTRGGHQIVFSFLSEVGGSAVKTREDRMVQAIAALR